MVMKNIEKLGYKLQSNTAPLTHAHLSQDGYIHELHIRVIQEDVLIAQAIFLVSNKAFLHPEIISVEPDHRRKGIATAIYLEAEQITGLKIIKPDNHSEEAEAFWKQKNKKFGT
jgi:GNAT superfamily N-acetyltransferase